MTPHFNNFLSSSFLLYIDNEILRRGQAYTNAGSKFYLNTQKYNNYYSYSLPFQQIVNDLSVNGATVLTGVYLNNSLLSKGQSGYQDFDYSRGTAYFSSPIPAGATLSGNFAVKDFSVNLSNWSEQTLMTETKYFLRPRVSKSPTTGIPIDAQTYPAIYLKQKSTNLTPFQLGAGEEWDQSKFTAYIFADSLFNLDNVVGIFKDTTRKYFGLLSTNEFPVNTLGGIPTGYNYTGLATPKIQNNSGVFIKDVRVAGLGGFFRTEINNLNPQIFFEAVEFSLEYHRSKPTN